MATESRSQFVEVITPGLFCLGVNTFKRYKAPWKELFTTAKSTKAKEEIAYISGLGLGSSKPEGTPINYDARKEGPKLTIVHDTIGLGLRITEEMIEDKQYAEMDDGMKDLSISGAETQNIRAFDLFNSTTKTSADGNTIFNATHTRLDGSTYSNLYDATSLSQDALEDDQAAFEALRDDRGLIINRAGSIRIVLVNSAQAWRLAKYFKSAFEPDTANNAINTFKDQSGSMKFIASPYVTSTTARYYIGEKSRHLGPIHFTRRPMTFAKDSNFETGDALIKYTFRDSCGVCNPMNIAKNAGA